MIDYLYGRCDSDEERVDLLATPILLVNGGATLDESGNVALPAICPTVPFWDEETDDACGRRKIPPVYPCPDEDDPEGSVALSWGARYYCEGMEYFDPADHGKRIDCFRAAEIFYLYAALQGNPVAFANLGYVYSYDRCEGRYWGSDIRPVDVDARAFECYEFAAEAGDPEACYKLGDLLSWGRGCEPDAARAFEMYRRALDASHEECAAVRGSAALRMAQCLEEGLGCDVDYGQSRDWYAVAARLLGQAVDEGDWFYEKPLVRAREGERRTMQEVEGGY